MRSHYSLFLALLASAAIGACDHHSPTAADRTADARANSGSSGDTATHGGTPTGTPSDTSITPPDSGSTYHGPVQLTVAALMVTHVASGGSTAGDSASTGGTAPAPNALVEALPISSSGIGAAQSLGHTNAQGVLTYGPLPSGPYLIRVTPAGGGARDAAQASVLLNQPTISVQVVVRPVSG